MKKFIFFLVEGNNDKREIQAILRATCGCSFTDNYVDVFHVHKGDITSERDSNEKTIIGKINKIILEWRNGGEQPYQRIVPSDVAKIIHVIDTDGVFIPSYAVVQTDDAKAQYKESVIEYYNRDELVGRNRKKARVIKRLLQTKRIDNIPFEVYFASCNMDHLLFNNQNPDRAEKGEKSFEFARLCKSKEYLLDSIFASGICAEGSYEKSWEMIQAGINSLHRHTNINLLLEKMDHLK